MCRKLEYHVPVQRLHRATGTGFALTLLAIGFLGLTLIPSAGAQVNGMPASVTSPGFGGRQVNGVAPSVTSLGPRGYTPGSPTCCFRGVTTAIPNQPRNSQHPHHRKDAYLPWGGAVYGAPYYGYYDSGNDVADDPPGEYNGGPTIFDRRGSGTAAAPAPPSISNRASNYSAQDASEDDSAAPPEAPASDQPQTILVFKDGHQLEVSNYAIVGSTLYDLTGGRRQKISLADLDLTATAKENDDRGIDFQLPAPNEAN
ncbi:MAG: hypothetical protein WB711_22985 [Terriglobales bacterium]